MTTRIPSIRWPGAVKYGASIQRRISCSKKADRLVVGQCRVLTPSISVAVTAPLHFQSDVQQRRFFASPPVSNNHTRIALDNLTVRSFSSTDGDTAASKRDDTNQQIISHAESGEITAAQDILTQMHADAISKNDGDQFADIDSYTAVMNGLIDQQTQLILSIGEEMNEIQSDENATMPNRLSSESNERGAAKIMTVAERVNELLIQMEDISGVSDRYSSMRGNVAYELRNANLQPTSHHYDLAITAFANAATVSRDTNYSSPATNNAPYVAQRWLQRMETLSFDPYSGVSPSVDSYYHVMDAYASLGNGAAAIPANKNRAPILAQAVFDKLKESTNLIPTVREHRLLIRAWSNSTCKEAAYKAMGLWMNMLRLFRAGDEEMEPTLEDGKMVLEAWSRAINKHSARRAQTVLNAMEKLVSHKKTEVRPDLDCYKYVLIAMSRSKVPDVGANVIDLFNTMEEDRIFPDTACFDAAIETFKNCSRRAKSEEAESYANAAETMLKRMEREHDRSSVSAVLPSSTTYTNVIQALAVRKTKKAAITADGLLKKMEQKYAIEGNESMKPTRESYVGVIHAYGNSGAESSYSHANEVFQRMITQYSNGNESAKPDVNAYHALIRACSRASINNTEQQRHALVLAIATIQEMKKSDLNRPNSKTYLLLLQCCIQLLPPGGSERSKALRSIFRSCCKDGLVDQQVLTEFQSVVSTDVYHNEVVHSAHDYNGVKALPESWTRNLGYRVRTHQTEDGVSKRNPIISVTGEVIASSAYNDHRMRRRWSKVNQKLLQGGRM